MVTINLEQNVVSQIADNSTVMLCDESGKPLGHFLSEEVFHRLVYDWAEASLSEEELNRRRQEKGERRMALSF